MDIAGSIKMRDIGKAALIVFAFLVIVSGYYYLRFQSGFQLSPARHRFTPTTTTTTERYKPHSCDLIHIGTVCLTHESKLKMYTMLKSLFRYRESNPIQLHIIVHPNLENSLNKLFETWALPDVEVELYSLENYLDPDEEYKYTAAMLRFMLPNIIVTNELSKIILLSTDILLKSDIFELWNEFQYFSENQFLGIQPDKYMEGRERLFEEVVLFHLDNLRKHGWEEIWSVIEDQRNLKFNPDSQVQLIFNHFTKSQLAYSLECSWSTMINTDTECISQAKVVHQEAIGQEDFVELMKGYDGNAVRKRSYNCHIQLKQKKTKRPITDKCSSFPESEIQKKRTLLYFFESKYDKRIYSDVVTLATQLTLDQFNLLEHIVMRWKGPMSITFYLTDEEFIKCIDRIKTSYLLKDRLNTGYHVVFKYGRYFHNTYLKNVALDEVKTPYVFSIDIHEMPMENLYTVLKNHLANVPNMTTKVLVVPAFESINDGAKIPFTKPQVRELLKIKKILIAQEYTEPEGHAPTDYAKWGYSTIPYKVTWKNMYKPYVVVNNEMVRYDERLFGDGLDQVLYIMELEAQGYEFYVLPNSFVVREFQRVSKDENYHIYSTEYTLCLKSIQQKAAQELNDKYGRKFLID